jgi:hypothetical protein
MVARKVFHKLARLDRTQSTLASRSAGIRASNRSYNGVAGSRQRYIWSASRQTDQSNAARRRAAKLDFVENDLEAIRAGWGQKAAGRLDVGSNAAQ